MVAFGTITAAVCAGDVQGIYDKSCAKCHGPDGAGKTKMGEKLEVKDFTDAKYQATFDDAKATSAIKDGIKDGDKTKMKPLENVTDEDIKGLVTKIRSFKK